MVNYHSEIPGGFFSADPHDQRIDPVTGKRWAASIRMNNPGAINGASWEKDVRGYVGTEVTTAGNATTFFETPEAGVDAYMRLLFLYHDDPKHPTRTLQGIILRYGGDEQRAVYLQYASAVSRQSQIPLNAEIDLNSDAQCLPLARAMFRVEAGRNTPLTDEQIRYGFERARAWKAGRAVVPPKPLPPPAPVHPDDFAADVIEAMRGIGAKIDLGPDLYEIAYVEGCNVDGTANKNRPNAFDDARLLITSDVPGGAPRIVGAWEATTEPGLYWTENRMNPAGAFHIALGQQACWSMGTYHDAPALVETLPVRGTRDDNGDMSRVGDKPDVGDFGVHHHGGYNYTRDDMGRSSAGCQVGRLVDGHAKFMSILRTDRRYVADHSYKFRSTVLTMAQVSEARRRLEAKSTAGTLVAAGTLAAGGGGAKVASDGHAGAWIVGGIILAAVVVAVVVYAATRRK